MAIKFLQITSDGIKALAELEAINETMWRGVKGFIEIPERS